jgi:hypothetical protein
MDDLKDALGHHSFKFENGTFYAKTFAPWVKMTQHPKWYEWHVISPLNISGILVEARLTEEFDLTLYQACVDSLTNKGLHWPIIEG